MSATRTSPHVAYAPALLWAAIVLGIGSIPDTPAVPSGWPLDKLVHLGLYGVLGWLAGYGWKRVGAPAAWLVVALALLVGGADELHQLGVHGRSAELADWLADGFGIITGFLLGSRARRPDRERRT